ncbi:unnamed protein product [Arabidopsis lyrata]|uniref:Predicted protein n=1 Tax=Arabidopsis lyrata subsp. lyrata TaxID=81972 RepID=D7MSR2_ARALL|nr:predicted protein [Arabidopsis lyrata subsp. lyrata]CAH8278680.1 unnamed protein product [Arabidopsis lyrata]
MLHGMLKHPYPTYNDMPGNDRELWFRTFAHEFNWDIVHAPLIRVAFHNYASSKFGDHMNIWKGKWVAGKECPKGLNPDIWLGLKEYWVLSDTARIVETNKKKPEEPTRWQRSSGGQCGFDELLQPCIRIDGEERRKGRRSASRSFLKMMMVPRQPTSLSEKRSTAWFLSLNQSIECSYSGPSRDSEIFAELEEKDKEILALKEQNKKILDFMCS